MADGSCMGDAVIGLNEKNTPEDCNKKTELKKGANVDDLTYKNMCSFYKSANSEKLFNKLSVVSCVTKGSNPTNLKEGCFLMDKVAMSLTEEEDCLKKRCADRYDSSESSDSGVAVLSCTDCSGSSTASSDITDPGSPFSTTSSHSEDSILQPTKMPPTQTTHHSPWPWAAGENPPIKRLSNDKTGFPKRLKTSDGMDEDDEEDENTVKQVQKVGESKKPPACLSSTLYHLNSSQIVNKNSSVQVLDTNKAPSSNVMQVKNKKVIRKFDNVNGKTQGKITEYFKTQMKANGIKKNLPNTTLKTPNLQKNFSWGIKQSVDNSKVESVCKVVRNANLGKVKRKLPGVTVPRKILPAPSKICDNSLNGVNNIRSFTPTVTLTTLAIPPNLTYLHTKTPKPPENFIVQQFTTISDKLNTIPAIVSTPCINTVLHPLTPPINNFSCFNLNTTVVPIVKINTLSSNPNGASINNVALNIDAGVPTLLSAKPRVNECSETTSLLASSTPPPLLSLSKLAPIVVDTKTLGECKNRLEESLPSSCTSPDSGVSTKEQLEVDIDMVIPVDEPQKSPILSQPKTIRFPVKQQQSAEYKQTNRNSHSADSTYCHWTECHLQFNTSAALLEHLQVKHVISQANQEHYECLWLGCKVHGRKSCSRSWLERHVLAHAGTKPFRCIFDGCGMRYNSQLALQRHVNGHFNADGSQNSSAKKSVENGPVKLFRRNGKKLRFRRQPWSARMFDFFDNGIMEGLQHRLLALTGIRTQGVGESVPGDAILLNSQIMARRIEPDGNTMVLLRWHPIDIIPDEWVPQSQYTSKKIIPIRKLDSMAISKLTPILFPFQNKQIDRHKQRRKPVKST